MTVNLLPWQKVGNYRIKFQTYSSICLYWTSSSWPISNLGNRFLSICSFLVLSSLPCTLLTSLTVQFFQHDPDFSGMREDLFYSIINICKDLGYKIPIRFWSRFWRCSYISLISILLSTWSLLIHFWCSPVLNIQLEKTAIEASVYK